MSPTVFVFLCLKLLAIRFGLYLSSSMASSIFLAVALLTGADLFKYADTVVADTPALLATSFILAPIFMNYSLAKT
jgi:hypothetical protein